MPRARHAPQSGYKRELGSNVEIRPLATSHNNLTECTDVSRHSRYTPIPPAAIRWGWCKSRNDSWSENDEWHASVTAGLLRFAWKWSGDLWQTLSFHFFAGLLPSGPLSTKSVLSLWEALCVRVKTRNFKALPQSNTPSRPDDTGYCSIGSGESESTSKLWNYQANSSMSMWP